MFFVLWHESLKFLHSWFHLSGQYQLTTKWQQVSMNSYIYAYKVHIKYDAIQKDILSNVLHTNHAHDAMAHYLDFFLLSHFDLDMIPILQTWYIWDQSYSSKGLLLDRIMIREGGEKIFRLVGLNTFWILQVVLKLCNWIGMYYKCTPQASLQCIFHYQNLTFSLGNYFLGNLGIPW